MSLPWLGQYLWNTFLSKELLSGVLLFPWLCHGQAIAQVIPDQTLPTPTSVIPVGNTFRVEAGTEIGSKLFHSFEEFSLPTGTAAIFTVGPSVETLLSRVTGSSLSNIDGLIQVGGSADFFLINPNGIVFGPNSSLDIGGSFVATTADHIEFGEGIFSARDTDSTALLSLNTPIGLQFGQSPGSITNFSRHVNAAGERVGLQVQPNQTLALLGGSIDIPGGQIVSPQSHIELGSLAGESFVGISPIRRQRLKINYSGVKKYQNIHLSQLAKVDSSGLPGGLVRLQGHQIMVKGGSQIFSRNLDGKDVGKGIHVVASDSVSVLGTGPLDGDQDAVIRDFLGVFNARRSSISTNNFSEGTGGNIDIRAREVEIRDGGDISVRALGKGKGGNLLIKASELVEVSGHTEPLGSTEFLKRIVENLPPSAEISLPLIEGASSASFIASNSIGAGQGGDITIETKRLLIRDGGLISTSPFLTGNGGDTRIFAGESVELLGVSASEAYSPGISIGPVFSQGKPGKLVVSTPVLKIAGGSGIGLSTSSSSGSLGIFNISKLVEITGTSPNRKLPSSISARSVQNGEGGSVELITKALLISDGGTITATGNNASQGGDINIVANSIVIDNQSSITTSVEGKKGGMGGNIELNLRDTLLLRRNSEISAKSGESGQGGNISLRANLIVAVNNENSDIVADAVRGQGGRINLVTAGVLGLQVSDQLTASSDISASSELGVDGTVMIEAPESNLNPGDIELKDTIEAPRLAEGCLATLADQNSFIQTGRGGLPINPASPVSTNGLWEDLEPLPSLSLKKQQVAISPSNAFDSNPMIVKVTPKEASDWKFENNGEVRLIALENSSPPELSNASTCSSN